MNNVDFDELLKQGVLCGKKMVPVYCTTDLSIFKENELNRDIKVTKVRGFQNSIARKKYQDDPYIYVLPDLTVADGHHRLRAIKQFLAQKNCPVKTMPVWFMVTDNPEFIHDVNTCGASWNKLDHINYYYKRGFPHYVYLKNSTKEIKNKVKEMHISSVLSDNDILELLQNSTGFELSSDGFKQRIDHNLLASSGQLHILIKKDYILNILPYYKEIQNVMEYQILLKSSSHAYKQPFIQFLVYLNMIGVDLDKVTSKVIEVKKINIHFSSLTIKEQGGVISVLFNLLGMRLQNQILAKLAQLLSQPVPQPDTPKQAAGFFVDSIRQLIKAGVFRPEGPYKQEEIMNRMEQEELMNQNQ